MRRHKLLLSAGSVLGALVFVAALLPLGEDADAHKQPHSPAQLKAFHQVFMEQVVLGDKLFHGDPEASEQMDVTLSETGMACAMCHPDASDTHPHEFPKYQQQMQEFATLRDMTNWCIEKPNQGLKIDPDGEAMKALEAYMYWANRHSPLAPGTH